MKKRFLFTLVFFCILPSWVISPLAVFAENTTPPAPTEPLTTPVPTDTVSETSQAPTDPSMEEPTLAPEDGSDQAAMTATPIDTLTALPESTNLILVDGTGAPVPLVSQTAVDTLANPDPYLTSGGIKYSFTAVDCDPIKDDDQPCVNPIGAAIKFARTYSPDDGAIYVEAGDYSTMDINLQVADGGSTGITAIKGAGSSTTRIHSALINNVAGFTLSGFSLVESVFLHADGNIILSDISIDNSSQPTVIDVMTSGDKTVLLKDVTITNASNGLGIHVGSAGKVDMSHVVSDHNQKGAEVENVNALSVSGNKNGSSSFSSNTGGTGLSALDIGTGGVSLSDVTLSGNSDHGLMVENSAGDVSINATITNNDDAGLFLRTVKNVDIESSDISTNNAKTGAYPNLIYDAAAVKIQNSTFEGNGGYDLPGLKVIWRDSDYFMMWGITHNPGNMTVSNSSFTHNGDSGLIYDGDAWDQNLGYATHDPSTQVNILDTTFNNNRNQGLFITGAGKVTLQDLTADANGDDNIQVGHTDTLNFSNIATTNSGCDGMNIWSTSDVTLTGINSIGNGFMGKCNGTSISDATGNISVTNSNFNHNSWDGLGMGGLEGNVVLSGVHTTENSYGIEIDGLQGNLTIANTTANGNEGFGLYFTTYGKKVTLKNVQTNENGRIGIFATLASGAVADLDRVSANGNFAGILLSFDAFSQSPRQGADLPMGPNTLNLSNSNLNNNGMVGLYLPTSVIAHITNSSIQNDPNNESMGIYVEGGSLSLCKVNFTGSSQDIVFDPEMVKVAYCQTGDSPAVTEPILPVEEGLLIIPIDYSADLQNNPSPSNSGLSNGISTMVFEMPETKDNGQKVLWVQAILPGGATPAGSTGTITLKDQASLPGALPADDTFIGPVFTLSFTDSAGVNLVSLGQPMQVKIKLPDGSSTPNGKKLQIQVWEPSTGKWVGLDTTVVDGFAYINTAMLGTFTLVLVPTT